MGTREKLLELRPIIETISNNSQTSEIESFQNNTIRPILKFQNDLLITIYQEYSIKHKNQFYILTINNRILFIKESIQKDNNLKNFLLGTVVAHFTISEYSVFKKHEKELKKRITQMTIQRLQDQVEKFELS